MSASDALSAVRTVYGVITKVRENREELLCVSRRIEYIIVSLEESRARDAIQTDEYKDALTTISDMITRTQRVAQRLLKRSIGDRTWNVAEITGEIRRLNEDVQNYLSVHAIRALDIMQASHAQKFTNISENLEEIMAKIAEIDLRLSTEPGDPWSPGIEAMVRENLLKTPPALPGLDITQDIQAGQLPLDPEGVTVRSLVAARNTSINITGLKKNRDGECSTVKLRVKSNASCQDIIVAIKDAGYILPDELYEDSTMKITVTSQESVYDATSPGGLQISRSEPLLWWWNKYTAYHGLGKADTPGQSSVELSQDGKAICAAGVKFMFHRTFRVPDARTNNLPPNLGSFPLFPAVNFAGQLPENIRRRGGYLMPMFRREALWISFQAKPYTCPAVKVSVGGVNVISGHAKDAITPPDTVQDYIVAGLQPWLDGIATEPGIVRQFVATVLGQGYTVEEQITGRAELGGFQFDVFPRRTWPDGHFKVLNDEGKPGAPLDNTKTTGELGIMEGSEIHYTVWSSGSLSPQDTWTISSYRRRVSPTAALEATYRSGIDVYGSSKNSMINGTSEFPPSGISPGGRISQKIYRDPNSPRVYDEEHGHRFHIHIISPEYWEQITGILPPITPITRDMYLKRNLPWYTIYDNYIESLDTASQALSKLRSVAEIDHDHTPATVATHSSQGSVDPDPVDPSNPPACSRHPHRLSSAVFRPCGHVACETCLGIILLTGSKCTSCGMHVKRLVGMTRAIPALTRLASLGDGGSEGEVGDSEWDLEDMEELAVTAVKNAGRIFTIHLREHRVAPLHSRVLDWDELKDALNNENLRYYDCTLESLIGIN